MKSLLFNATMIKAWLADNKTVTRRLVKINLSGRVARGGRQWHIQDPDVRLACPLQPGETIYIRETWMGTRDCLSYKASDPRQIIEFNFDRWKTPLFMPEWAARCHARIVSVRPERIQEINEADVHLEGFRGELRGRMFWPPGAQFKETWNKCYPGSWERNDWVWRIELEKI